MDLEESDSHSVNNLASHHPTTDKEFITCCSCTWSGELRCGSLVPLRFYGRTALPGRRCGCSSVQGGMQHEQLRHLRAAILATIAKASAFQQTEEGSLGSGPLELPCGLPHVLHAVRKGAQMLGVLLVAP